MKKLLIILLLLGGVGFAGWKWYEQRHRDTDALVLYGNVDIREVNLGFRVGGRILKLAKDEGDVVAEGETLAELDAEPYLHALQQAEANVAALKARLTLLETGNRREEIEQAKATVAEREATLSNARRLFRRQEELLRTKVTSQQEYDDAAAALKEAEARVELARAGLELQQAGFRTEEIAQAKAELTRAEAAVAAARLDASDAVLKSPSAGVVITRAQEPGAIVASGATILTVSLDEPVWARAYIDEAHLGAIHPGKEVQVFTDSRPDRAYRGRVGYVSPRAEFTPKSVETPELRTSLVYRMRIVIQDPDPSLRQGMPVTVKLP